MANAYGPSCECHIIYECGQSDLCGPPPKENKYFVQILSERDVDMDNVASRSKQDILRVANARCCGLDFPYRKYSHLKSDFNGNVTLKFTIAPSGKITSISIVSSTTDYPKFDKVVKDRVKNWIWRTIKSGETTATITLTFYFLE